MNDTKTVIGANTVVKGNVQGDEDVIIEGRVEGTIAIAKVLVIERTGEVHADIEASAVVINGALVGNITAMDAVQIGQEGRVMGDIRASQVILAEGAAFRGNIDMGEINVAADREAKPAAPVRPSFPTNVRQESARPSFPVDSEREPVRPSFPADAQREPARPSFAADAQRAPARPSFPSNDPSRPSMRGPFVTNPPEEVLPPRNLPQEMPRRSDSPQGRAMPSVPMSNAPGFPVPSRPPRRGAPVPKARNIGRSKAKKRES